MDAQPTTPLPSARILDVSRYPSFDGDAHSDAAGWADRGAVVAGVGVLPDLHAVSLARERNSDLPFTLPLQGRPPTLRRASLQRDTDGCAARAPPAHEIGRQMKVDIEVKGELYCVLVLVTGANELIESPTPYDVGLGHFGCLELSRSHLFPLDPQC